MTKRSLWQQLGSFLKASRTIPAENGAPGAYLQLKLALVDRAGLVMRVHFRFEAGDGSYPSIRRDLGRYIGRFRTPQLTARARALAERVCKQQLAAQSPISPDAAQLTP